MTRTDRPAGRTVQSVDKAMALLWTFDDSPSEQSVSELARKTGLSASNVSRLLSSLVQGKLLEYNAVNGRYRLSIGLVRLASRVTDQLDLRTIARPHLQSLVAQTKETASLSIFAGEQAVTIDFVASPLAVVSVAQLGRPGPVHCTSVGKALLAFQTDDVVDRVLSGKLPRLTPRTVTDAGRLRSELRRIRELGYALAEEEREPELNAIAVPVRGTYDRVVAALGLQGPAHRFHHAAMLDALPLLQREALAISRQLGA